MIATVASLLAVTGLLAALPLAPALIEMRQRRDIGPMPVKNRTEMVADLAHDFRSLLEDDSIAARRASAAATLVLEEDWFVDKGALIETPVYAKGRLAAGGNNVFAAIFCEKDIDLGNNTRVGTWVHAQGIVIVPMGSSVEGRLSAAEQVELGSGSSFKRVDAPAIITGDGAVKTDQELLEAKDEEPRPATVWDPEPRTILEQVTERLFAPSDFLLEAGAVLRKNVVARGEIHLAEGSHLIGCLKSNRRMVLAANVRAEGSLVSASDLRIGRDCRVVGPVIAEGELMVESGTTIGSLKQPTTVQAPRIRIAPGVTIHGSLCACELGQVAS
jgi:predicted acyltransferase (DUF342 family)